MKAGLRYLLVGFVIAGFFLAGFGATWLWQRLTAGRLAPGPETGQAVIADVTPVPVYEEKVQKGFRQVSADARDAVLAGELGGVSRQEGRTILDFKFLDRTLRFVLAEDFYLRKQKGDAMYPTSDQYETIRLTGEEQVTALEPLLDRTVKLPVYTGPVPENTTGLSREAQKLFVQYRQFADCNRIFGDWAESGEGEFDGCLPLIAEMYALEI